MYPLITVDGTTVSGDTRQADLLNVLNLVDTLISLYTFELQMSVVFIPL